MKLYISAGYYNLDDLVWQLRRISRPYNIGEVDASSDEIASIDSAVEALIWYVSTGRSYMDFDKALKRANLDKLIRYMVKDSNFSGEYNPLIKSAKKYLSRFCGMPKD